MWIVVLAMVALIGLGSDDRPADLVARLGSHQYAEREADAEALRRLGPAALPALRDARSSADLEIKTRALALRDEIVSTEILHPAPIKLDFQDRPRVEVIEVIGRQAGLVIEPGDEQPLQSTLNRRVWPDRRITLEAAEPLPFWDAIDRLCQASGLRLLYPSGYHFPDAPLLAFDLRA
jgi:hypothetical protein